MKIDLYDQGSKEYVKSKNIKGKYIDNFFFIKIIKICIKILNIIEFNYEFHNII